MEHVRRINSGYLPDGIWAELKALRQAWLPCSNYLYSRFSGINSMSLIQDFKQTRDMLVRSGDMKRFKLQTRQWKMSLTLVLGNIKSMWSNLKNRCIKAVKENPDLPAAEKSYLYFVFGHIEPWQAILVRRAPVLGGKLKEKHDGLLKGIADSRLHSLHNLVRRTTRKHKPNISHMERVHTISVDEGSYAFTADGEGNVFLEIMGLKAGERIAIPMPGAYCTNKGNLQLVFDDVRHAVSVRKFVRTDSESRNRGNPVEGIELGLDKGYSTMVSLSNGHEYGEGFGTLLTEKSDWLCEKNRRRQPYYAKVREIDGKLADTALPPEERGRLAKRRENILKNNLGRKKYSGRYRRTQEVLKSLVNHELIAMFRTERPSLVVLENLNFVVKTKKGSPKYRGRKMNRRLSSWMKGYLDGRIAFQAERFCARTEKVNAAYTSQYCSRCGRKVDRNNEVATCPRCGKMNANINAAANILERAKDDAIDLYTPYREVKKIMEARAPA